MKKNIAMRVAAFLFILTMISTCAFATTFAKYTTGNTATDEARVAKWGVNVVVTGNDAFKTDYESNTTGVTGNTVSAKLEGSSKDNLVAPGTAGTLFTVTVSGTPEVDTLLTKVMTLELEGWAITGDSFYCPIVITVGSTPISGLAYDSADEFEAAVIAAVQGAGNQNPKVSGVYAYEANADIAQSLNVTWTWAFEGGTGSEQTNDKDTLLGNLGTAPTIEFSITYTVEQVD